MRNHTPILAALKLKGAQNIEAIVAHGSSVAGKCGATGRNKSKATSRGICGHKPAPQLKAKKIKLKPLSYKDSKGIKFTRNTTTGAIRAIKPTNTRKK